jgi:hypothetical protein
MTAEERYQQFLDRYESVIRSGDISQMQPLGEMVKRVMKWLINYEPVIAEQAITLLDGDKIQEYRNHLSAREADEIVSKMEPQPQWSLHHVLDMLKSAGYATEEPPYFNNYALATTMCMILSDSGETLKNELGSDIRPAKADEILRLVYKLAIDKLKDKDGKFNIRKYFDL